VLNTTNTNSFKVLLCTVYRYSIFTVFLINEHGSSEVLVRGGGGGGEGVVRHMGQVQHCGCCGWCHSWTHCCPGNLAGSGKGW
jgi:hypothetical protein